MLGKGRLGSRPGRSTTLGTLGAEKKKKGGARMRVLHRHTSSTLGTLIVHSRVFSGMIAWIVGRVHHVEQACTSLGQHDHWSRDERLSWAHDRIYAGDDDVLDSVFSMKCMQQRAHDFLDSVYPISVFPMHEDREQHALSLPRGHRGFSYHLVSVIPRDLLIRERSEVQGGLLRLFEPREFILGSS